MQNYPDPSAGASDGGPPFYTSTSSQQASGLHSQEDIQLTAQLSRSLAPMMNSGVGGNLPESQDHQEHSNVNHHYNHDPNLSIHGQSIQGGHGPIDHMGLQYPTADSGQPPRKRSKVSRACDECRRKKIKCDASGDQGEETTCSNCTRTRSKCEFSRQPLKRGPSKGYIRDLADRLNSLEGAIQPRHQPLSYESPQPRRLSDDYPPSKPGTGHGKRSFSAISSEIGAGYPSIRASNNWSSQEEHREAQLSSSHQSHTPPAGAQAFQDPEYTPNGLQPSPQWRMEPSIAGRQNNSFDGMDHQRSGGPLEPSDGDLERYRQLIHPTFPIILQSKVKLTSSLSKCHITLVNAFNESLIAAIASFSPPSNQQYDFQQEREAARLTMLCQLENFASQSFATSLIHLQALLLMAITAGNRPPNSPRDQNLGPPGAWVGTAVGIAYQLRLHIHKRPVNGSDSDSDSDDRLARNLWWILVIMDKWHAASTGCPVLIPDTSIVVYKEDRAWLEEPFYQFARLSIILGHFSEANLVSTDLPLFSVSPVLGTLLRGEIERWREDLSDYLDISSNAPLIHISCWLLRTLKELVSHNSEPKELLNCAKRIVNELTGNPNFISPLEHHSVAVAALCLIELTAHDSTKDEAQQCLATLSEIHIGRTHWNARIREYIGVNTSQAAKSHHVLTASQGLQRLADIATAAGGTRDSGTDESRTEPEKNNAAPAGPPSHPYQNLIAQIRGGYLNSFL